MSAVEIKSAVEERIARLQKQLANAEEALAAYGNYKIGDRFTIVVDRRHYVSNWSLSENVYLQLGDEVELVQHYMGASVKALEVNVQLVRDGAVVPGLYSTVVLMRDLKPV